MQQTRYSDADLNEIVEKYSDLLIRISFSYMKNTSDAQDVTQDVLLKLVSKQPFFESESHQKAWLIRVAINLCKNRLRTRWFRRSVPLEEQAYHFTPKENEVMEAVFELPVKYRSIILLFYFEGYSIADIARILQQKETTVGSQLHRARKQLKSKLKEEFDDEKK